MPSYKM